MSSSTSIEWTEATWNPVVGCSVVSPGCTNCYAMRDAWRKNANPRLPRYHGLTKMTKGGPVWTGKVRTVPELLDWPLRKRKPLRIFVNSMSDLFHGDVPDEFIDKVFAVMALTPRHTFQILTKRAERMRAYMMSRSRSEQHWEDAARTLGWTLEWEGSRLVPFPPPNVWLLVSVEDQKRADERIPLLLQTPAAVRGISAEPLLGPVQLRSRWLKWDDPEDDPPLDWVVVGGESGSGARPFDITWARSLRDQCRAAGVPYFLKQVGAKPYDSSATHIPTDILFIKDRKGGDPLEWPEDLRVREYPTGGNDG